MILTQSVSMIVPLVLSHAAPLWLSHKNRTNRTGFDGAVGRASPGTWQSGWILDPKPRTSIRNRWGYGMETVNMEAMIQESRWFEHVDFPWFPIISFAKWPEGNIRMSIMSWNKSEGTRTQHCCKFLAEDFNPQPMCESSSRWPDF